MSDAARTVRGPRPYWNPYLAGALLGLTLLGTFLIAGQGLGGSAVSKRSVALVGQQVAPEWTAANTITGPYVADGRNPMKNWIVIEVMGFAAALARGCTSGQALSGGATLAAGSWVYMMMVFAGGYATAYFARRLWI